MNEREALSGSAGSLLRAARERQGLHIAALAAAIKVAPRKLDALENDRWHELPDATFARALAQTVCRTLKIDALPVLDRMPAVEQAGLENVAGSLNTPFNGRGGSTNGGPLGAAIRPMVWAGLALLVAAAAVYLLPADLWPGSGTATPLIQTPPVPKAVGPEPAASMPSAVSAAASPLASVVAPAAVAVPLASASVPPARPEPPLAVVVAVAESIPAPSAAAAQLHAVQASWVEVRDAQGKILVSRQLAVGERLGLDGPLPLRLTIGNAGGTELAFRGRPVDLAPNTRSNVARIELQ